MDLHTAIGCRSVSLPLPKLFQVRSRLVLLCREIPARGLCSPSIHVEHSRNPLLSHFVCSEMNSVPGLDGTVDRRCDVRPTRGGLDGEQRPNKGFPMQPDMGYRDWRRPGVAARCRLALPPVALGSAAALGFEKSPWPRPAKPHSGAVPDQHARIISDTRLRDTPPEAGLHILEN